MTTFDTLTAARGLEEAGMDANQAAAVTEDGLVTRSDLDSALAQLETRMTRTLYGVAAALLAGQLAAVLALLRLLG